MKIIFRLFLCAVVSLSYFSFGYADSLEEKPSLDAESIELVNINSADMDSLLRLSGVGEKRAAAIIEWREANGGFSSVEDLTKVKGIGQSLVEKNRLLISVK